MEDPLFLLDLLTGHEPKQRKDPKMGGGQRREQGEIIFVLPNLWEVQGNWPADAGTYLVWEGE